jgi:MFS family permease
LNYSSNLWKLNGIRMLFWMQFFSAVLVPFYTDWGGLKLSQILYLNAWFMFFGFMLEVPTGAVADYLGRKHSLALGSLLGVAGAYVYASRPGFNRFLLAEFILAGSYALHSGADEALAYDSLKMAGAEDKSKQALARMESFKLAGIIVAALSGGFIAARYGLRTPMLLYAVPCMLGFFLALTLHEPPVRSGPSLSPSYLTILKEGGRFFLGHKILLLLAAELALTHALAWVIIWLFQPALARLGVPIAYFGIVQTGACLGQIAVLSNIEKLEGWLKSKRQFLLLAGLGAGAGYIALGFVKSPALCAGLIILVFSLGHTRAPVFSSYMNKYIPSEKRATVLSMASMLRTLAIVIVNPLIGLLADRSLTAAFYSLGASLIALAIFSRIEEKHLIE